MKKRRRGLGDTARAPIVGKSFKTPKGCHVRHIAIDARGGNTARISYDCGGGGGDGLIHPSPDGGVGNYPSARIKGVRAIEVPGARITGYGASVDFVLSPRYVTCRKRTSDSELTCKIHLPDGGTLSGAKRKRR